MTRYPLLALLLLAAGAGFAAQQFRERLPSGAASQRPAAAPESSLTTPEKRSLAGHSRLPVTAAQSRAELAAGGILRPVRSLLNQSRTMHYGSWRWDEHRVAPGPMWVRIDLDDQLISVFRGGHEIGTAVMVYGTDGMRTPTGVFPIKSKTRDHRSSLYDAPMPYTLRLTDDGVSIHGSSVRYGAATHGCIGVPIGFARHLFEAVGPGDQVLILPPTKDPKRRSPARPSTIS